MGFLSRVKSTYKSVDTGLGGLLPAGKNVSKGYVVGFGKDVKRESNQAYRGLLRAPSQITGALTKPLVVGANNVNEASKFAGQIPVNLTAGIPQVGSNVGQGAGNLLSFTGEGLGA